MKKKVLKEGIVPQYVVVYLFGDLVEGEKYAPLNRIFLTYEDYQAGVGAGLVSGLFLSFSGMYQVPVNSIRYIQFLYPKGSFTVSD